MSDGQPTRRAVLAGGLALAATGSLACGPRTRATRMPAIFVGHGAPTAALDLDKAAPWRAWGEVLPGPRAILVVSAHWEDAPVRIGATSSVPLVYDFYGFPQELYEVTYAAPGAPELADRVAALVPDAVREERGLDHGAWVPLLHLAPSADVPVLQISLPTPRGTSLADGSQAALALGRALAPLKDEGVLLVGSGNLTHNLRAIAPDGAAPESWASEFDAWAKESLQRGDVDALVAAPDHAPAFRRNHPSPDHWYPLLFALGAGQGDTLSFPVEGFEFGNLSRRAVQWG